MYLLKHAFSISVAAATALIITSALGADDNSSRLIQTDAGAVSFEVATNMPGIEVAGKSNKLSSHVEVSVEANRLVLRQIDAVVPVKSLGTGMKMRDEHMRRYIFRTPDGQEPDIHFVSASATCEASGSAHDYTCPIQGTMTLQGVPQPIDLHLRVKEESRGVYHASGDAMLKLSAYGIAQPTQFGVKPLDEVKIHLEFTGRGQSRVAEAGGSR